MPWTCRVCEKHEAGFMGCSWKDCPSNSISESQELAKVLRDRDFSRTPSQDLAEYLISKGYRKIHFPKEF